MRMLPGIVGGLLFAGCADPEAEAAPDGPADDSGQETVELPEGVHLVDLDTTAGPVVIEVHEDWAPLGAERFLALVDDGFYDGCKFFRVVPGFVVQFGLAADPADNADWAQPIADDPVVRSNNRRTLSFATAGANTRTTQVFVNLEDNPNLDGQGFSPFGRVVEGIPSVNAINAEYGQDPDQAQIRARGNDYLDEAFPNLDGIVTATRR